MHDLWIYDTRQRKKRRFQPVDPDVIRIYVCGPTVYDRIHIGNGRSAVVFDVFVRFLRAIFPTVKYVRNITDVEDKINQRALELGIPISQLTAESIQALEEDYGGLGVLPPDVEPRATDHIFEIIELIQALLEFGHAYEAEGHVLFHVPSDPHYGTLTNRSVEELLDGARVEVAPYKLDPKDFVLWKPSTDDLPGWESPWGRGRPGWHIECSAMIDKHLGEVIDIHGGGSDLAFPHHENEMSQSTCFNETQDYVHYWMHNGMLNFGDQKMSKSLGNVLSIQELLAQHDGEVLRYALVSGHYRQTLRWDDNLIAQSRQSLTSMYTALRKVEKICGETQASSAYSNVNGDSLPNEVLEPLLDDLNTPRALAGMHSLVSRINQTGDRTQLQSLRNELLASGWILGLLTKKVSEFFEENATLSPEVIKAKIQQRAEAKKAKNFELADSIRASLLENGIVLEDSREGTTWRVESHHVNEKN